MVGADIGEQQISRLAFRYPERPLDVPEVSAVQDLQLCVGRNDGVQSRIEPFNHGLLLGFCAPMRVSPSKITLAAQDFTMVLKGNLLSMELHVKKGC
jgi:hypothetical protein